ncbi:MAG: TetR/AcrR family transcriptional regulator [Deltaproteobacteria bacterium]|nr:TetR/AcrR family transcriptional regulator [Deltaproteobacteria bacterium]
MAKRRAIIKAARKILADPKQEFNAAAIARELGWNLPGIYYYFENIQAIKEALIVDLIDLSVKITLDAGKRGATATESLLLAFEARVRYYMDNPNEFDLTWSTFGTSNTSQEFLEAHLYPPIQQMTLWFVKRLEIDKTKGLIHKDVPSRKLMSLMTFMAQGMVANYLTLQRAKGSMYFPLDEMIQEGKRILQAALKT